MINLLPPDIKQSYRYAERNVSLTRWAAACVVALVGIGIITTYGLLYMHQQTTTYSDQVAQTNALLKRENVDQTQKQVQSISNSLRLVVKVLSKEVLFSKLLKQIAAAIPANAVLTNLNINQVQGGIDITANATDYNTATQVQVNLADPANKIFSKADIINITCNTTQGDKKYPCTVQIRALFAANNPFLFISNGQTASGVKP